MFADQVIKYYGIIILLLILFGCTAETKRDTLPLAILDGNALYDQALMDAGKGNYVSALKFYNLAFNEYSKVDYSHGKIFSLLGAAGVNNTLGDSGLSDDLLQKAEILIADNKRYLQHLNLTRIEILFENDNYSELIEFVENCDSAAAFDVRLQIMSYQTLSRIALSQNHDREKNTLLAYYTKLKSWEEDEIDFDPELLAFLSSNLGVIFESEGNHTSALKYLFESLKLYKELSDFRQIGDKLERIAEIYSSMGEEKLAAEYSMRADDLMKSIGVERENR